VSEKIISGQKSYDSSCDNSLKQKISLDEINEKEQDWPNVGDRYFFLMADGINYDIFKDDETDSQIVEKFKNKEKAEWADGIRKLNAYLRTKNNSHVFNYKYENYYLRYSFYLKEISVTQDEFGYLYGMIYFKDVFDDEKALSEIPKDLKKYLKPREK